MSLSGLYIIYFRLNNARNLLNNDKPKKNKALNSGGLLLMISWPVNLPPYEAMTSKALIRGSQPELFTQ